jgi:hypothetical protein
LGVGSMQAASRSKKMSSSKPSKQQLSELNRELIGKTLHSEMINFVNKYNDIDKMNKLPSDLDLLVQAHFSEVSQIIVQFMVNSFNTKSGRPRDQLAREYFRSEVNSFQIKNNGSKRFPSEKNFFKQLDAINAELHKKNQEEIKMDTKTFTNFKREWKDGTF